MEKHNQLLFAIYDADFGIRTVFNTESTADALRGFADMCKNNAHMKEYADKFQLWKIGEVNAVGEIKNEVTVLENATTFAPEKQTKQAVEK